MISVCMATHNGEMFILPQVESILKQLTYEDELIISDDGSTDKTIEIISSLNDKRISIYKYQQKIIYKNKHKSFYYATKNFENALKQAKGDIIILSDQDDIWGNNKVSRIKEELKKYDFIQSNFSLINDKDEIIMDKVFLKNPLKKNIFLNIKNSKFFGSSIAFNKCVKEYVLPFPTKLFAHDFWIGTLACYKFKFLFIDEPLTKYRKHSNNVSPASGKSNNTFLFKITYRLVFLIQILRKLLHEHK